MTPDKPQPKWPEERAVERIDRCRLMLQLHGFLTEVEGRKVLMRIAKWNEQEGKKGT